MINSVIFDIGQVLLSFKPLDYLKNIYKDEAVVDRLYENIFRSKEWIELDRGTIEDSEAITAMCHRDIVNKMHIEKIMNTWTEILSPIDSSIKLALKLKEEGFRLYLLSNFHSRAFREVEEKYSFFKAFDGSVISSHVKLLKPEKEIYNNILQKYDINSVDTLFIDDMEENCRAAEDAGIKSVHYQSFEGLYSALRKLEIL